MFLAGAKGKLPYDGVVTEMPWDQCGSGQGRQCLAVCLSLHVAARCNLSHQMQTGTCAHQGKKRGMQLSFSARKLSEKINWCTV